MIVALGALHRAAGLEPLVVAPYQAASGGGQAGIDTLHPAEQGCRRRDTGTRVTFERWSGTT
jgi:aspartate-semialdehyde dehydrogenase